jgi:hypothetical protein
MAIRPFPRRVASPASTLVPAVPPRLWPNLPAATQVQVAQLVAKLLRRMRRGRLTVEEGAHADRRHHR